MRDKSNVLVQRLAIPAATAILVLGLTASPSMGAEKVDLRLSLKPGQSYHEKLTLDQDIKQTVAGQNADMHQVMAMGYRFQVVKVDNKGRADCKVTYESVAMTQEGPTGKKEYDSSKTDADVPMEMKPMAAMVGQGFTLTIAPNGAVTNVKGADELVKKMFKDMNLPAATRDLLEKQLKGQFGNKALGEMMEKMLAIYPDKPVGIGDSWQRRQEITVGMPMIINSTWTLKGVHDGVADIDVTSKIDANSNAKPMEMGPMSMKFNLSGDQKGTIKVPVDSGWTTSMNLSQDVKGKVEVNGAPGAAVPLSWPMTIISKIKMEAGDK